MIYSDRFQLHTNRYRIHQVMGDYLHEHVNCISLVQHTLFEKNAPDQFWYFLLTPEIEHQIEWYHLPVH